MQHYGPKPSEATELRLREALDAWMESQGDLGAETEMDALQRVSPSRKRRFLKYSRAGVWTAIPGEVPLVEGCVGCQLLGLEVG